MAERQRGMGRGLAAILSPTIPPEGSEATPELRELRGPRLAAVDKLARAYAHSVGRATYAERYWLLLPPREADGMENLPAVVGEESRDA